MRKTRAHGYPFSPAPTSGRETFIEQALMPPLGDTHQGFAVPPPNPHQQQPKSQRTKKPETWKVGKLESWKASHPAHIPVPPAQQHDSTLQ